VSFSGFIVEFLIFFLVDGDPELVSPEVVDTLRCREDQESDGEVDEAESILARGRPGIDCVCFDESGW